MQKQIIRPHFAISTCCTVLSSHGDDPSWFNTKHFFFWAWNPRSRHSTPHICSKCITFRAGLVPVTGPHLFEHNFLKAVGRTQLEGKLQGVMRERLIGIPKQIESCTFASKTWGALEAAWQMTPSRAAFVCLSQWWSIMNSIRSTVAFEHEIPGADVLLFTSAPNASHFEPNLFQWQVPACLNRISDKERSCKVYVGKTVLKTSWKLQPCKGEVGSIEAPWKITPPAACLTGHSCEKCWSNYVPEFWPAKANAFFNHLEFFLKWNIIGTASYGIGYDCWPNQYKDGAQVLEG